MLFYDCRRAGREGVLDSPVMLLLLLLAYALDCQ